MTASASHIIEGKTAYVAGSVVTGTMPNRSAIGTNDLVGMSTTYADVACAPTNSGLQMPVNTDNVQRLCVQPPNGYYSGYTYIGIPASDLGTATAAQVLSGKTFTSTAGIKASGTMTNNGAVSKTLTTTGSSYTIPAGYHNGSGKVTATITNLSAANIKKGVTVGGVAGTYDPMSEYTISISNKGYDIGAGNYCYISSASISSDGLISLTINWYNGRTRSTTATLQLS